MKGASKNKRGLSAVVTTLLIILLAIVAIGIVWTVVRSIISQGAENISLEQITLDLGIKNAYVDSTDGDDIKVGVRRSAGAGDLTGIRFIFFDGTQSTTITRNVVLGELEEQVFSFDSATEVSGIGPGDTVSVAPVFETSSGNERTGAVTDTEDISDEIPAGGAGAGGDGEGDGEGEGAVCGNNICEEGESALTCSEDCAAPVPSSCDNNWVGSEEDEGVECDGGNKCPLPTESGACTCPAGYTPDGAGGCVLNAPLNSGLISSIWPSEAPKYLDSIDFPKDSQIMQAFIGQHISFTESEEIRCLQVSYAEYLSEYNQSYIRVELVSDVLAGDGYDIWEADDCGFA